ncbi:39S ribosomal protein L22, mitochondrial [Coemansia aciculifera]|uniref:39S ribosomal protein L22, mitochondrial n=1 Tax=Coemansia aciculifera TaxID=417176 RepID=A0A9W8IKP0_9FUNG|nr:39S ribosomal protein L22, mitochondrial [Coemansia aciculifera]KAJ2869004.1 39S ribosomal protein L22, mitochondrial [Coemansia aciculifera]KAJ2878937.1 39S ribosomal protein L22, mitochondrial [Coemansia aciculifera]
MFSLLKSVTRLRVSVPVSQIHSSSATLLWGKKPAPQPEPAIEESASQKASSVFEAAEKETKETTAYQTVSAGKGEGLVRVREYTYSTANFHASPRKLRMIGNQISGLPVTEAIRQMQFSSKKASDRIKHSLVWARKNAMFQREMNPENMFIKLARVGKGKYRKRIDPKARGRYGMIRVPYAHMKYVLWEKQPEEKPVGRNAEERALLAGNLPRRDIKGFKLYKKTWMPLNERKPVINPKPFYNW